MGALLAKFLTLPRASKIGLLLGFVLVVAILFIAYYRHESEVHRRQAEAAQRNANVAEDKVDALKILVNTNTIAGEVENDKKTANQQAINSNIANNVYVNTRKRDSNQSSNVWGDARTKFCLEFPEDSLCQ